VGPEALNWRTLCPAPPCPVLAISLKGGWFQKYAGWGRVLVILIAVVIILALF